MKIMFLRPAATERHYRPVTQIGKLLGRGRFGSVIELTSCGELLAGKVFTTDELHKLEPKVYGEVITMLQFSHPNIVQCKGVAKLPRLSALPVLLMERLMTNLHDHLLQKHNSNLPMERKMPFLLDTARGLDYLHSCTPAIIHRDLTARNVLLDSQLTAKISDFGNSRIMDLDLHLNPRKFTPFPGTLEYMAPEAQGALYGPSVDIFSFGHLSLFTVTQSEVRLLPSKNPRRKGIIIPHILISMNIHIYRENNCSF